MGRGSCFGFSILDLKLSQLKQRYRACGLKPEVVELDNGVSVVRCQLPWEQPESGVWSAGASEKPVLLFLHDFVADGMINWEKQIRAFTKGFNVYVPDLVFFGCEGFRCSSEALVSKLGFCDAKEIQGCSRYCLWW